MTEERYQLIRKTADQINSRASLNGMTREYLAIRYLNDHSHESQTINDMLIPNSDDDSQVYGDYNEKRYRAIYPYRLNGIKIRSEQWLAGLIIFFFVWFIALMILVVILGFIGTANINNTVFELILVGLGVLIHYILQVVWPSITSSGQHDRVMEKSILYVLDGGHKTVQEYREYWDLSNKKINKEIEDSLHKL